MRLLVKDCSTVFTKLRQKHCTFNFKAFSFFVRALPASNSKNNFTLDTDRNCSPKTRPGPSKILAGEKLDKTGERNGAAGEESHQTMGA